MFLTTAFSNRIDVSQVDFTKILFLSPAAESFSQDFCIKISWAGMLQLWNAIKQPHSITLPKTDLLRWNFYIFNSSAFLTAVVDIISFSFIYLFIYLFCMSVSYLPDLKKVTDLAKRFFKKLLITLTTKASQLEIILLQSESVSCFLFLSKNWTKKIWSLALWLEICDGHYIWTCDHDSSNHNMKALDTQNICHSEYHDGIKDWIFFHC